MVNVLEKIVRIMKNKYLLFSFRSVNRYACWIIFNFCLLLSANGLAFNGDVRVDDDSPGARKKPAIALDRESNIYVVWQDEREGMWNWTVYFAKSNDGGQTFGPNVRVGSSSMWFEFYAPSITIDDSGTIYVAWYDEGWYINDYDIYITKSIDGGSSFAPRFRVDHGSTSHASRPKLAVNYSGKVYVTWEDDQELSGWWHIYMNSSNSDFETFDTTDLRVDTDLSSGMSFYPSLVPGDSGDVYVTWSYWEEGSRIYFNKSTDGGNTFGSTCVQVDDGSRDCSFSKLAVDDAGNLYVVWVEGDYCAGTDIYFDKSTDSGASFGPDMRVNDVDSTGYFPSMEVDGKDDIFVVWQDRSGDGDIYFSMSPDRGITFSEDMRVDHQEWGSGYPSIAADESGNVYVVWEQQTQYYGVPDAIYFTVFNAFTTCGEKGDVNLDGAVNILDVMLVVNIKLRTLPPTGYQEWAADFNSDGVVDILDIVMIINLILNHGTTH